MDEYTYNAMQKKREEEEEEEEEKLLGTVSCIPQFQ
jgi:hypothetical protein